MKNADQLNMDFRRLGGLLCLSLVLIGSLEATQNQCQLVEAFGEMTNGLPRWKDWPKLKNKLLAAHQKRVKDS